VCKTKEDAKKRVDQLIPASFPDVDDAVLLMYRRRAKELVDNPDELHQGGFGVCGMASVLHEMLRHDLPAFTDLIGTIFTVSAFRHIMPGEPLLAGRVKQRARKKSHSELEWEHGPDFIIARTIGKLLKLADPTVYQQMVEVSLDLMPYFTYKDKRPIELLDLGDLDLSEAGTDQLRTALVAALRDADQAAQDRIAEFDLTEATVHSVTLWKEKTHDGWWFRSTYGGVGCVLRISKVERAKVALTFDPGSELEDIFKTEGDLALNYLGVETIMTAVLGKDATSLRCGAGADAAVAPVNQALNSSSKTYVIAFVNGSDAWKKAHGGHTSAFSGNPFAKAAAPPRQYPGRTRPVAQHIICITGQITEYGAFYRVPAWSWGRTFTATIPKAHFATYLDGFTFGTM
jgi:hypothetical protein